jgi:hypothetical protein
VHTPAVGHDISDAASSKARLADFDDIGLGMLRVPLSAMIVDLGGVSFTCRKESEKTKEKESGVFHGLSIPRKGLQRFHD